VQAIAKNLGVTSTALHLLGLRTILMVVGELRRALLQPDNKG
jgi:hypothetical protein